MFQVGIAKVYMHYLQFSVPMTDTVSNFHGDGHSSCLKAALIVSIRQITMISARSASMSGHKSPLTRPMGFLHSLICFVTSSVVTCCLLVGILSARISPPFRGSNLSAILVKKSTTHSETSASVRSGYKSAEEKDSVLSFDLRADTTQKYSNVSLFFFVLSMYRL